MTQNTKPVTAFISMNCAHKILILFITYLYGENQNEKETIAKSL